MGYCQAAHRQLPIPGEGLPGLSTPRVFSLGSCRYLVLLLAPGWHGKPFPVPPVIPVQHLAGFSLTNETKKNKPLEVAEMPPPLITVQLWVESMAPGGQEGGSEAHYSCQRSPAVSTRHAFRSRASALRGRHCRLPTKSLLRVIKTSLLLLHCYVCGFADVNFWPRVSTGAKPSKKMDNAAATDSIRGDAQGRETKASFWIRKPLFLWFVSFPFHF